MPKKKTTEQFIQDAYCKHQDEYNYKLVDYKNAKTKVKIICPIHGIFEQTPNNHVNFGHGCNKCSRLSRRKTTEQFIQDAIKVHGDKYDYSLVDYKNARTKIKIICPEHGVFEQRAENHLNGNGCPKCGIISIKNKQRLTTEQFIEKAKAIHGDKYDYSLVEKEGYKNSHTKIKIICPVHGVFEQMPYNHLDDKGCYKCAGNIKKSTEQFIRDAIKVHGDKYDYSLVDYKNCHTKIRIICNNHNKPYIFEQVPTSHLNGNGCINCTKQNEDKYELYANKLLGVECRRNKDDNNVLEVKCMYCDRWFIPSLRSVRNKIRAIDGYVNGEHNLYCSDECKKACPTFNQKLYPKGFKTNTSREVQPALRKLVLKRDNYTCQKCNATNKELHCHHYEGIEINPIESADIDNCITLCINCHHEVHSKDKCGMRDYKKDRC